MEKKREAVYDYEAQKRWNEKNKEKRAHITARGSARSFIRKHATLEDLDELEVIISKRRAAYPHLLDTKNEPIL